MRSISRPFWHRVAIATTQAMLLATVAMSADAGPLYRLQDLGDLPGGANRSVAQGVNAAGVVAGHSEAATGTRAFIWQDGAGLIDIGDLPGGQDYSLAFGINAAGQVVGNSGASEGAHGFVWSRGSGMTDLGTLPGGAATDARAINGSGQVTGIAFTSASQGGRAHAFLWDAASGIRDLGVPVGARDSYGNAINDAGQVAGTAIVTATDTTRAFLWSDGVGFTDLVDLPGGRTESAAYSVNSAGKVAGFGAGPAGVHAVLWTSPTSVRDLGDLPGGENGSYAWAISDSDAVVGESFGPGGRRAFVWRAEVGMLDLNDLVEANSAIGWTLESATGIDELGRIVGYGTHDGAVRAFLLMPVPEPDTYLLLFLGLGFLGAMLRSPRERRVALDADGPSFSV